MKAAADSRTTRRGKVPAYLLALEDKLAGYLTAEQIARVRRAYEVGALAHKGQTRKSGEPYITHPVAVAGILAELGMDAETIIAAILHDTLEDTQLSAERADRGIRRNGQRTGRRRHQARQAAFQEPPGSRRRELPQDAAGDGARPARDPDQAGRSPAQHAHARLDGGRLASPDRPRNARDLRADRPAPGHEPVQGRTAGSRLPRHVSGSSPGHFGAYPHRARQPPRSHGQDRGGPRCAPRSREHSASHDQPDQVGLQHLPQDAHRTEVLCPGHGRLRLSRRRRYGDAVLSGARRRACPVQAAGWSLPRFHRDPEGEWLPVPAHRAVRFVRRADRDPDPHRGHGRGGRSRRRRALGLQERLAAGQQRAEPGPGMGVEPGRRTEPHAVLARIHRERQGRPVSRRGLPVHAARADPRPAAQRDRARFRLCRAYRCRQPCRGRAHRQEARATAHAPEQRPVGGDHHRAVRRAEHAMAGMGGQREGAHGHPPLSQAPAARGRHRARPPHARSRHGCARRLARGAAAEPADPLSRGQQAACARGPARRHRAGQPHRRPGRPLAAAAAR